MNIREMTEEKEYRNLSSFAAFSRESKGRIVPEQECDIRTAFQRDRDRILHCKAFRRLKDKTQVFLSPYGDHYRTRLTHTLEVSQIARTIARALSLNEDLVEAIALAHDMGHTPFGHAGESALQEICPLGFAHNEQSLRIVDVLEKGGSGLNLTWEVRDGIKNHRSAGSPATLEGKIVRVCDKIAYLHHDTDDAERAGIINENDIPITIRVALGYSARERLNMLIHDIVENSIGKSEICQSAEARDAMAELREHLFQTVYRNNTAKSEEVKAKAMVKELYRYFDEHPEQMTREYTELIDRGEPKERVVCDYISGMTDQYSIHIYNKLFVPESWAVY